MLPSTTSEVSVTAVNLMTSLGALGFLVGAGLLTRVGIRDDAAGAAGRAAAHDP